MPTLSIRRTVPLAILVPLLTSVGIIGYISFYNGQKTVKTLTSRLSESAASKVKERLNYYLQTPHNINQSNANAIELGQLNWRDPAILDRYYRAQSRLFPDVDAIELGYEETGDLRQVLRTDDNKLQMVLRDQTTNGAINTFELNSDDTLGRQLSSTPDYDARKRDWYKIAVEKGKPVWTPPSLKASTKQLRLSAVYPIVAPNTNKIVGVQAVELFLSGISDFLRAQKVSPSGQIFIVERSGGLIAASAAPVLVQKDNTITRVQAGDTKDPLIQSTVAYVNKDMKGLDQITRDQELRFSINGEPQLGYVTPFKDQFGLDWLIFIVIPEKDFTQSIQRTTQLTFLVGISAVLLSTILGLWGTQWIVRPILELNAAANEVKLHTFKPSSLAHLVRRPDELGQLAKVFEEMAQVVLVREQSLAEQVQQLQEQSDSERKAAIATRSGNQVQALLARSRQVRELAEHHRNGGRSE